MGIEGLKIPRTYEGVRTRGVRPVADLLLPCRKGYIDWAQAQVLLVCYTPLASVRGPYYLGVGSISGSLSSARQVQSS